MNFTLGRSQLLSGYSLINLTDWTELVLQKLDSAGVEGHATAEYLRAHRTRIGFRDQGLASSAMWWVDRNIYVNPRKYPRTSDPGDPYLLSLIVHETVHLQQGLLTALSVYGELQAWQVGFAFLRKLDSARLNPVAVEILTLPFGWDRAILKLASLWMVRYNPHYRINRLPLYPLHREIWYTLTQQVPD